MRQPRYDALPLEADATRSKARHRRLRPLLLLLLLLLLALLLVILLIRHSPAARDFASSMLAATHPFVSPRVDNPPSAAAFAHVCAWELSTKPAAVCTSDSEATLPNLATVAPHWERVCLSRAHAHTLTVVIYTMYLYYVLCVRLLSSLVSP